MMINNFQGGFMILSVDGQDFANDKHFLYLSTLLPLGESIENEKMQENTVWNIYLVAFS